MGVAGYVVCAEAFFEYDSVGIALDKSSEACFQALPGSDDAGAGQFGSRQVEQVVDVPVQVLVSLTSEISVSQTDGIESPEHFLLDYVGSLPAAPGGVADQPVGQ